MPDQFPALSLVFWYRPAQLKGEAPTEWAATP